MSEIHCWGRWKYVLSGVISFCPNLLEFGDWLYSVWSECRWRISNTLSHLAGWLGGGGEQREEVPWKKVGTYVGEVGVGWGGLTMRWGRWLWEKGALSDTVPFFHFPCAQPLSLSPSLSSKGQEPLRERENELFFELLFHKGRSWGSLNSSQMAVPHNI